MEPVVVDSVVEPVVDSAEKGAPYVEPVVDSAMKCQSLWASMELCPSNLPQS